MEWLQLFILCVIVFIICVLVGCAAVKYMGREITLSRSFLFGEMVLIASFELVAPWFYLFQRRLSELMFIWGLLVLAVLVISVKYARASYGQMLKSIHVALCRNWSFWKVAAVAILLLQFGLVLFWPMQADPDDWQFIGEATQAYGTGWLNRRDMWFGAVTGEYSFLERYKYFTQSLTTMIAVLSKFSGLHPLITAHWFFAGMTVLNVCTILMEFGEILFQKPPLKYIFVICVLILKMFGAIGGGFQYFRTFFYIIPWQGKAIMPNVMFPVLFLTFLYGYDKLDRQFNREWAAIGVALLCCAFANAMGTLLGPLIAGCFGIVLLLTKRRFRYLLNIIFICIPEGIMLSVMYLLRFV